MADLRTDYQDDVLDASKNTARVYDLVDSNGTVVLAGVHLEDKTVYATEGDDYGAADINEQNGKINELSNDLSDKIDKSEVVDNLISTSTGAPLSANQGRILNEGLNNALKKDKEYDWSYSDTSATIQQHLFNVRANLTPLASSLSGGIGFAKIHFEAQNNDNFAGFAYFDSTNIYGIISSFSNGIAYSFTCTPTSANTYLLKN